jgi:hypothetical protein
MSPADHPPSRRVPGAFELAVAALGYLALTVLLTWPLAPAIATHWPAPHFFALVDQRLQAVVLAHEARTIFSNPAAFPHAPFFAPAPWALYYGEAAFGALPLYAVPYWLTANPVLALNVVLLGGITLTAVALYGVARSLGARPIAAAVAGGLFVVNPWTVRVWGVNAPNFTLLAAWPVVIALAASADVRQVGWLAVLLALQAVTSAYLAVSLFLSYAVVIGWRLVAGQRQAARRLVGAGLFGGVAAASVMAGHLWIHRLEPDLNAQRRVALGLVLSGEHLFDSFFAGRPAGLPFACLLFLGVGTWLARRRGTDDRRVWWHLLLWIGVGVAISLPPMVVLLHHEFPTPAGILGALGIPFMDSRDNRRFGLGVLMGIALAVALAIEWLAAAVSTRFGLRAGTVVAAIACVLLAWGAVGQFSKPVPGIEVPPSALLPLHDPQDHDDAAVIAALREIGGAVLELPLDPVHQTAAMLRAVRHGHPLVNGSHSYYPAAFARAMQVACALPAPEAVRVLLETTGAETILVRRQRLAWNYLNHGPFGCLAMHSGPALAASSPQARAHGDAAREAFDAARVGRSDLTVVVDDPQYLVFRVVRPPGTSATTLR